MSSPPTRPSMRSSTSLPSFLSNPPALAAKLVRRTTSNMSSNANGTGNGKWYGALLNRLPACGGNLNGVVDEDEEYREPDMFRPIHDGDDDIVDKAPTACLSPMIKTKSAALGLVSPCAVPSARCHSTPIAGSGRMTSSSSFRRPSLVTPQVKNDESKLIKSPVISKNNKLGPSLTFETVTTAALSCDDDEDFSNEDTLSTCSTQVTANNNNAHILLERALFRDTTNLNNKRPSPQPLEHEQKQQHQRRRLQSPFRKSSAETDSASKPAASAGFPPLVRMQASHYDLCEDRLDRERATITVLGGPLVFSDDEDSDSESDESEDISNNLTFLHLQHRRPSLEPPQLPWLR